MPRKGLWQEWLPGYSRLTAAAGENTDREDMALAMPVYSLSEPTRAAVVSDE